MKKLLSFVLALFVLSSCGNSADTAETLRTDIPDEVVIVKPDAGKIVTLLDEAVKITECEFVENPPGTRHNPPIFFEGDTMYIYKFPAFTAIAGMPAEEASAYLHQYVTETTEYTYEIEVYADPASGQASEIITLQELNGDRVNFYQLFKSGDSLILIGSENVDGEWLRHCYEFAMDGSLKARELLTGVSPVADCYPLGNAVYYCDPDSGKSSLDNSVYDLCRYDRETGEITIADERGVILLFESAGVLYCLTPGEESDEVVLSSLSEDVFTEVLTFTTTVNSFSGAEYNAEKRILYLFDYQNLYTIHADDNTTRKILFTGDYSIYPEGITEDWILVRNGGYAITAYRQPEEKISLEDGQEVIRIYSTSGSSIDGFQDDIDRSLNLSGYNVAAKSLIVKDTPEYINTLAKKLLAGDSDFDIFIIDTEMSELFKAQYYEDLSRYTILQKYFSELLPGARNFCKIDGIIALIPRSLGTSCLAVHTDVSDLNPSAIETWDDLLDLKDSMNLASDECIMSASSSQKLVRATFAHVITNYMRDVIDDEQAKADLAKLYRMYEDFKTDPLFVTDAKNNPAKPFLTGLQNRGRYMPLDTLPAIPQLVMSVDYKQSWTGTFFAINPNSPNKELAAAYIAYTIEYLADNPGTAEIYNRPMNTDPRYGYTNNEKMHDLFCDQLENGVLAYEMPDFTGYFNRQFADIEAGKLTLEEAADDLFKHMKRLRDE